MNDNDNIKARYGNDDLEVLATSAEPLLRFDWAEGCELVLTREAGWEGAIIKPTSLKHALCIERNALRIKLSEKQRFLIEQDNRPVIIVTPTQESNQPPKPCGDGRLYHFARPGVVEMGTMTLSDGDVVWIEPDCRAIGHINLTQSENVIIGGGGILDADYYMPTGDRVRPIVVDECQHVEIRDLTIINSRHWMLTVGGSRNVKVDNLTLISAEAGQDGIDIVGSQSVQVTNCFLRNGDDNVAIKALNTRDVTNPGQTSGGDFSGNWNLPVKNILVQDCVTYNDHGGSAMEIGFETRADRISDITFRNIIVMAVHSFGSVFGIHNGDRAIVENVLWENIDVEHYYDRLVDFRVLNSMWNSDVQRGRISDIELRNIRVHENCYNTGYSKSIIGGLIEQEPVQNITFAGFRKGDHIIENADDLDLYIRHATGITYWAINK